MNKFLKKLFCEHQWAYKAIDERFDQFNVAYTVRKRCLKCGKIQRFYGKYGKEEFEVKRNGYQPKGENPPATTPKPPLSGSGIKSENKKQGRILSDITKRELIVEGFDRARDIDIKNNGRDLITIETLGDNLFKVILIKRVGSFYSTEIPRKSEY